MTNGAKLDVDRLLAAISLAGLEMGQLYKLRKALADEFPEILWIVVSGSPLYIRAAGIDAEVITESYEP